MAVDIRVVTDSAKGESKSDTMKTGDKTGRADVSDQGMRITRRFTRRGIDPLDEISYESRDSVITNPDGSVVFEMRGAEIPSSWSQLATDIAVSKYFRRAGLFGDKKKGETSAKQLVVRQLGVPLSSGCVRENQVIAKFLYDWAPEGTLVVVTA